MQDLKFYKKTKLEKAAEDAKIDLGECFLDCKTSLINFKDILNELKMLEKDPENYIHEYFSELRNKIDLEREVAKELVDKHYLKIIDEVNKFEENLFAAIGAATTIREFQIFGAV